MSSPEMIRLVVMMYVRFPLLLPATRKQDARFPALEIASRRDVHEAERRDGLPLARGRSGGQGPRKLRHEGPRQGSRTHLHEEGFEAPCHARDCPDRRT